MYSKMKIFMALLAIITLNIRPSAIAETKDTKTKSVAIINYGPHPSLEETIKGIKKGLEEKGYVNGKNIKLEESNVNFDANLIPLMISKVQASKPDLVIMLTTPVAQAAKHSMKNTSLIYAAITDPVAVGLIPEKARSDKTITGASDQQDAKAVLGFIKQILPNATRIGLPYAPSEANNVALKKMFEDAAKEQGMTLVAIGIDQPQDIPMRLMAQKDKIDAIYVGGGGIIQPALPAISATAQQMKVPVFNLDPSGVKDHQALASFSVTYEEVGRQAGLMASEVLEGKTTDNIKPFFPSVKDHQAYVSKKMLELYGIKLPPDLNNVTIIE